MVLIVIQEYVLQHYTNYNYIIITIVMMFPNYYVGRIPPLVEQQLALLNAEVKGLQAA